MPHRAGTPHLLIVGPPNDEVRHALPARRTKVFISADMEGVTGVVTPEQLGPGGFEYERFRGFMTDEVLVAIAGARAAGAAEILVADAHGNGQNLLIERLPDDVRVVRSWPRPLGMVGGIDDTFDAALFIGYHSAETLTPAAGQALIRRAAEAGVRNAGGVAPHRLATPITLDITFKNYRPAEVLAFLPSVERVDAHTIRFVGRDMPEVSRFLQFMSHYQAGLSP